MNNRNPTLALIGCGYTLSRLASHFDPEDLVLVVRSSERSVKLSKRFPYVHTFSIADRSAVSAFLRQYPEVTTVVDSVPPGFVNRHPGPDDLIAAIEGNRVLATETSSIESIRRVIYLSTTGVYGVRDGSEVDESTPVRPENIRAQARVAVEEIYRALPIESVILRVSAIYGPGRGVGTALKAGSYTLAGTGDGWSNRIQVTDLVSVLKQTISAELVPNLLVVSDGEPARQREIVQFYCETFGFKMPAVSSLEDLRAAGSYSRLSNQRVNSARMKDFVGTLQFPSYREGAWTEFD